jgi:AhpD family alkylhydroperoxidase
MTTSTEVRISLKQTAEGNERVAQIYEALVARRGIVPNMFKAWAHVPALLETVAQMSWAMLDSGALPGSYKELLAVRVSILEGCEYGVKAHQRLGAAKGATPEQIATLDGPQRGPFTQREKLGFAYAERILQGGTAVDDTLFAAVKTHFTEAEVVELTAVATGILFLTRFIDTLRIPVTPAPGAPA